MGISLSSQVILFWGPQEVPSDLNPTGIGKSVFKFSMLLLVEQYEIVFIWPFLINKNMIFLFSQIMAWYVFVKWMSPILQVSMRTTRPSLPPHTISGSVDLLFPYPWVRSLLPAPQYSCPRSRHPGSLTPICVDRPSPWYRPILLWDSACLATNLLPGFFFFQVLNLELEGMIKTLFLFPNFFHFWAQCFTSSSQVVRAAVIQIEQMTDCTVSRNEQNWQAGFLPHPGNCSRDTWSCSFLSRGCSPQDLISHLLFAGSLPWKLGFLSWGQLFPMCVSLALQKVLSFLSCITPVLISDFLKKVIISLYLHLMGKK